MGRKSRLYRIDPGRHSPKEGGTKGKRSYSDARPFSGHAVPRASQSAGGSNQCRGSPFVGTGTVSLPEVSDRDHSAAVSPYGSSAGRLAGYFPDLSRQGGAAPRIRVIQPVGLRLLAGHASAN